MPTDSNPTLDSSDLLRKCESPEKLHAWLVKYLDLHIPQTRVCPGHCAPFDYLWDAYHEPSPDMVVWAPRGGGKTRLAAVATLLDLLHKPGCSVRILGGSMEQSMRVWEYLVSDIETHLDVKKLGIKIAATRIRLKNGSSAAVLSQSQRSVRGVHVQKMRCDEVDLFEPPIWQAAQLTIKSRSQPEQIRGSLEAISTYHRIGGMMESVIESAQQSQRKLVRWCILEVLQRCPPERECMTCPLHEDCRGIAKEHCNGFFSIDDAIALKLRVSRDTWNAEMLCKRPSTEEAVFPMFDESVHVRDNLGVTQRMHMTLGVDFGFNNPFVALWCADDGERVHVVDEHVRQYTRIPDHVKEIRSRGWGLVDRIHCDPAGNGPNDQTAQSNVKYLQSEGFSVRSCGSKIADGIEQIRAALDPAWGEPTLYIDKRCKHLIAALRGYRYESAGTEKPLKDGKHDHLIDALRYFFINRRTGVTTVKAY